MHRCEQRRLRERLEPDEHEHQPQRDDVPEHAYEDGELRVRGPSLAAGYWEILAPRYRQASLYSSMTLREPQYQSSELMLGITARGSRVVELPMSMRLRKAGKSKKGG